MAAWACKSCIVETGHGSAPRGWCAIGRHFVKSRLEYHPDRDPVIPGAELSVVFIDEAATLPPMSVFSPTNEGEKISAADAAAVKPNQLTLW